MGYNLMLPKDSSTKSRLAVFAQADEFRVAMARHTPEAWTDYRIPLGR
jgi:hypothetical protein